MRPAAPKPQRTFLPALLALVLTFGFGTACRESFLLDEPHVPNQLVIGWTQPLVGVSPTAPTRGRLVFEPVRLTAWEKSALALIDELGTDEVRRLRDGRVSLVQARQNLETPDLRKLAKAFKKNESLVRYVVANSLVYFQAPPVNDPEYIEDRQWSLDTISAPGAWQITHADEVLVAVVDSGMMIDHLDLVDSLWVNPCEDLNGNGHVEPIERDGLDTPCPNESAGNGAADDFHGWNFVALDDDLSDNVYHGTHVSGIIGAVTNNAVGIAGVAWGVRIAVVKVGHTSISDAVVVADGVDYAREIGAQVINMSITTVDHPTLRDAIVDAGNAGIFFVVAAGNRQQGGVDIGIFKEYPAAYDFDHVIAVTSTTDTDGLEIYANYGASVVELGAPGTKIVSTLPGGGYFQRSGSSLATAHVTGVVALLRAANGGGSVSEIRDCLSKGDEVLSLAAKTVWKVRLNAEKAVAECASKAEQRLPTDDSPQTEPQPGRPARLE